MQLGGSSPADSVKLVVEKDDPYLPDAPMNFRRRWREVVESFPTDGLPEYQVQPLERVKKHCKDQAECRKRAND